MCSIILDKGGVLVDSRINTDLIHEYMTKNGLCKKTFCKRCGISISTYDKVIKQQENLNIIALFKIARAMNLYIKDLFVE